MLKSSDLASKLGRNTVSANFGGTSWESLFTNKCLSFCPCAVTAMSVSVLHVTWLLLLVVTDLLSLSQFSVVVVYVLATEHYLSFSQPFTP